MGELSLCSTWNIHDLTRVQEWLLIAKSLMFHVEHSSDNSVNIGTALRGRVFHVEHPNGQEQFHAQNFVPRETSCICF